MKSPRGKHNLFAVSAGTGETAINVFQALDTTMLISMDNILNIDPRREDNADELNGMEEASMIHDLGALSGIDMAFDKAQPQHFAFLFAYGLGNIATVAAGAGYEHTITPIEDDLDRDRSNPSLSGAFRYGKNVLKRRVASLFVDSVNATFAKDSFVKISGSLKGTGKYENNITDEVIVAAENVTTLTLAANGVEGSTASARVDNVHSIRAETSAGVWEEVDFSAVSSATPAEITITAPGIGTGDINYKIIYVSTEAAWCSFPAKVVETALRVSELIVNVGGKWNGTEFVGGRELTSEVNSIETQLNNSLEIEFTAGAEGAYASRCFRPARTQTIKLGREFRDYLLQSRIDNNETFGFYIKAQGASIDQNHNYQVEMIYPLVGVLSAPISVDGKKLAEGGDLVVLEDAVYGSSIVKVKNEVAGYAG